MVDLPRETRLAILIDAENISPALVKQVLLRLKSYKVLTLKRAYGDWSKSHLNSWKSVLTTWGIHPVQAPTYSVGKNSADMTLAIDAMHLLYQQKFTWFCLISHDSDFTPLVHRLTESGAKVVGFGSNKVSQAFANACDKFISLDCATLDDLSSTKVAPVSPIITPPPATPTLQVVPENPVQSIAPDAAKSATPPRPTIAKEQLSRVLQDIFRSLSTRNNWVNLNQIHTQLQKRYSGFSCKQFGYSSLIKLIESVKLFELRQQSDPAQPNRVVVEIRLKRTA
jgi:uncharacterized protein (TIGR00288 family)